MKLDIRLEGGQPAIFWTDCPDVNPGRVMCFTLRDGHNEACRAYMRQLPRPETPEQTQRAAATLAAFGRLYATP